MTLPLRAAVRPYLIAYAAAALTMLIADGVWLATMNGWLYQPALKHLLAQQVVASAALLFYALYLLAVVVLAVRPGEAVAGAAWPAALGRGALFGLAAYGTYDLTNQATLIAWPWHITLIDLIWGTTLTGVSAAVSAAVTARWARRVLTRA